MAGPDRRPARPAGADQRRRPQGRPLLGRLQRRVDAGVRTRQRRLVGPERRVDGVGDQPETDAAVVYYHDTYLPTYYEIAAQIRADKPVAGWNANAYVIFDYYSPTNFKFAGINVSTNKYEMGYRDATGWHVVRQTPVQIKPDMYYNMLVAVNGTAVSVMINGAAAFEYVFPAQIVDGQPVPLNKGLIGLGSQGAKGTFDNVAVQVLKPQMTLDETRRSTTASPSASPCRDRRPASGPYPAAASAPPRPPPRRAST